MARESGGERGGSRGCGSSFKGKGLIKNNISQVRASWGYPYVRKHAEMIACYTVFLLRHIKTLTNTLIHNNGFRKFRRLVDDTRCMQSYLCLDGCVRAEIDFFVSNNSSMFTCPIPISYNIHITIPIRETQYPRNYY